MAGLGAEHSAGGDHDKNDATRRGLATTWPSPLHFSCVAATIFRRHGGSSCCAIARALAPARTMLAYPSASAWRTVQVFALLRSARKVKDRPAEVIPP